MRERFRVQWYSNVSRWLGFVAVPAVVLRFSDGERGAERVKRIDERREVSGTFEESREERRETKRLRKR